MISELDKLGYILTVGLILLSTWGFPGQIREVEIALGIGALLYLLAPLIVSKRRFRKDFKNAVNFLQKLPKSYWPYLVPLFLMLALIIFSCLNPSFELDRSAGGPLPGLREKEHVAWLPSSAVPEATKRKTPILFYLLIIQGPAVFLIFRRRGLTRVLLWTILINTIILSIAGIFVKGSGSSKILWSFSTIEPRYFFSTFNYKNHWGAYCILNLGIIGALLNYYVRYPRHQNRRSRYSPIPILILAGVIIGLTVPISGSRSCSLLYGGVFSVLLTHYFSHKLLSRLPYWSRMLTATGSALTLSTLLLWTSLQFDKENKEEIFRVTKRQVVNFLEKGKLETRFYISRDTWKMFQEKPIWGWGLGTYEFIINIPGKYLGDEHEGNRFENAHNDWFQYMAETGSIGFLLLAFIILTPLFMSLRQGQFNPISNWLWGTIILMLLYSFVEFPCRTPAVALLITIMISIGTKYSLLEKKRRPGIEI